MSPKITDTLPSQFTPTSAHFSWREKTTRACARERSGERGIDEGAVLATEDGRSVFFVAAFASFAFRARRCSERIISMIPIIDVAKGKKAVSPSRPFSGDTRSNVVNLLAQSVAFS